MGFESLDCGCPIRKPSDGREALHGQMKGIAVLIAGPAVAVIEGGQHMWTETNVHINT